MVALLVNRSWWSRCFSMEIILAPSWRKHDGSYFKSVNLTLSVLKCWEIVLILCMARKDFQNDSMSKAIERGSPYHFPPSWCMGRYCCMSSVWLAVIHQVSMVIWGFRCRLDLRGSLGLREWVGFCFGSDGPMDICSKNSSHVHWLTKHVPVGSSVQLCESLKGRQGFFISPFLRVVTQMKVLHGQGGH